MLVLLGLKNLAQTNFNLHMLYNTACCMITSLRTAPIKNIYLKILKCRGTCDFHCAHYFAPEPDMFIVQAGTITKTAQFLQKEHRVYSSSPKLLERYELWNELRPSPGD